MKLKSMPPLIEENTAPKLDTLGRVLFTVHTQNPIEYDPDEHDIEALAFIHRHTMAASNILFEFGWPTTRYDQFHKVYLTRLYDGEWLDRPAAQEDTKNSYYNRHVYVLTKKAEKFLKKLGKLPEVVKHSGPFPHQLMGATFTATIEIMCRRQGYRFIPPHELVGSNRLKLEIPFEWEVFDQKKKEWVKTELDGKVAEFNPDYLYGIQVGKSRMAFLAEFNRDTEPMEPSTAWRRSDLKTVRQMKSLIGDKEYKQAYGFNCPMVFQFITVTEHHARYFIDLVAREIPNNPNFTASVMPTFRKPWKPCPFPIYLFENPWLSIGKEFTIKKPAS